MTTTSDSSIDTAVGAPNRVAAQIATVSTTGATPYGSTARTRPRTSDSTRAAAHRPSSSQIVPGIRWPIIDARVKAVNDTRSPCGMKITRVTENAISNPIASST